MRTTGIHRHDLDKTSGNIARVLFEWPTHDVVPLIVEFGYLFPGEVGPQPR